MISAAELGEPVALRVVCSGGGWAGRSNDVVPALSPSCARAEGIKQ